MTLRPMKLAVPHFETKELLLFQAPEGDVKTKDPKLCVQTKSTNITKEITTVNFIFSIRS